MRKIVPDYWPIPDTLRQRLGERAGKQRCLVDAGHALLVLHRAPRAHERTRQAVVFWRSPAGEWRSDPGKDSIDSLREHVETYGEALEELEERVEGAKRATEYFAILQRIQPLVRATRNMHAAISQLKEQCANTQNAEELIAIRDRAYELERVADFIAADAENGMEFMVAQHAEETADISVRIAAETHRLNLLAAVCLPVTALGAILGMNLQNGLEGLPEPLTFWLVVAAAFGFGYFLRNQVQKSK
jgi:Mg2+ and Co2+ transporter CorA